MISKVSTVLTALPNKFALTQPSHPTLVSGGASGGAGAVRT